VSFVRPELQEKIVQWQEPLIHVGFILVELWVFWSAVTRLNVTLQVLCVALLLMSSGLLIVSIRKLRLRGAGTVQGHVEVDERRITYFTGGDGWSVSINDLRLVELHSPTEAEADMVWVFKDILGTTLTIPSSSTNVDALFDALAALQGVDYEGITRASTSLEAVVFTIWTKPR
jgi:hypothetical protein